MRWAQAKRLMFGAVERGEVDVAIALLQEHPELTTADGSLGDTLLHAAAKANQVPMLELLTSQGMLVDMPAKLSGGQHVTALHRAADGGAVSAAKWLLEHGASVDPGLGQHATPLIAAAMQGSTEMIELLLTHGANLHATYQLGDGPSAMLVNALRAAELEGQRAAAQWLASHGATPPAVAPAARAIDDNSNADRYLRQLQMLFGTLDRSWYEIVADQPLSVTLRAFRPTNGMNHIALVTDTRMNDGDEQLASVHPDAHTEFVLHLPGSWPLGQSELALPENGWPIIWLRAIAHHLNAAPRRMELALIWTADQLGIPDKYRMPFTGAMFLDHAASGSAKSRGADNEIVQIATIICLLPTEMSVDHKQLAHAIRQTYGNATFEQLAGLTQPNREKLC